MEVIEVDGVKTNIKKQILKEIIFKVYGGDLHICPLCRKPLQPRDEIYLLMNNYELFPNIMIHTGCVLDNENLLPIVDWEGTIMKLKLDYEQAKSIRKNNVCWFAY